MLLSIKHKDLKLLGCDGVYGTWIRAYEYVYSPLSNEDFSIEQLNKQFKDMIKEAALDVSRVNDRQSSSKLSGETNKLMQKHRISDTLDSSQPKEQEGFRTLYTTKDHVHTHTQIRINDYRKSLYMALIDYKKAFDSIHIRTVLEATRRQGVNEVYWKMLEDVYKDGTATIKLHTEEIFKRLEWQSIAAG
ncbi:uncharacterized protein LOC125030393 [Penaeus chinensis]|uniref:uncharacterized protein LOC125030393 n=1 Tax=Penaeus chinensis TaxID=139456 RepID=UPI001FB81EFD|nr:uncharacterized protein LOC125030393 [Penaeus chinensis]